MLSNFISLLRVISSLPLHLALEVGGGYETGFCFTSGHLLNGVKQLILDAVNEAH